LNGLIGSEESAAWSATGAANNMTASQAAANRRDIQMLLKSRWELEWAHCNPGTSDMLLGEDDSRGARCPTQPMASHDLGLSYPKQHVFERSTECRNTLFVHHIVNNLGRSSMSKAAQREEA
jgi:hypothetical protein